jgi:hypothetical protein
MVQPDRTDRDQRSAANLTTPEAKIFVEMVRRARGDSRALSGVAYAHESLGLPTSWMRERMAGRIRVKAGDLEILERLIEVAQSNPYHGKTVIIAPERSGATSAELRMFRVSVRKMCRECVGADTDEAAKVIGCPDRQCPLRDVSPLSLCANPIEHPERW